MMWPGDVVYVLLAVPLGTLGFTAFVYAVDGFIAWRSRRRLNKLRLRYQPKAAVAAPVPPPPPPPEPTPDVDVLPWAQLRAVICCREGVPSGTAVEWCRLEDRGDAVLTGRRVYYRDGDGWLCAEFPEAPGEHLWASDLEVHADSQRTRAEERAKAKDAMRVANKADAKAAIECLREEFRRQRERELVSKLTDKGCSGPWPSTPWTTYTWSSGGSNAAHYG